METSLYLAQLIGVPLVAVALAMLFNMKYYLKMIKDLVDDKALYFFSGISALFIGMALILSHNVWVKDWPVIITLFGWGALLKGFIRVFAPEWGMKTVKSIIKNDNLMMFWTFVLLVIGAALVYFGFCLYK